MHSPLSFCKNASPTFSMVHLIHRLYGVDAPAQSYGFYSEAVLGVCPADDQVLLDAVAAQVHLQVDIHHFRTS